jgi:hypothetical protein
MAQPLSSSHHDGTHQRTAARSSASVLDKGRQRPESAMSYVGAG